MEPYVGLLLIVILIICYQENCIDYKISVLGHKISLSNIVLYVSFVIFYSVRYRIGHDFAQYERVILTDIAIPTYGEQRGEWISAYLMSLATMFDEPAIYFSMIAIISFFFIIYVFNGSSDYKGSAAWGILAFLSVPIGFIESLSVQRQFLSITILLFGMQYIIQRRFVMYFFVVLLSSLCHMSSAIFICLYWVHNRFIKTYHIILVGAILFLSIRLAVEWLINTFPVYAIYFESSFLEEDGGFKQLAYYFFLMVTVFFCRRFIDSVHLTRYDFYAKNFLIGVVLAVELFSFWPHAAIRLGAVCLYSYFILLPYILNSFKQKVIVKFIAVLILSIFYALSIYLNSETGHYLPYQTIFMK